jgi:hypothetical protein
MNWPAKLIIFKRWYQEVNIWSGLTKKFLDLEDYLLSTGLNEKILTLLVLAIKIKQDWDVKTYLM